MRDKKEIPKSPAWHEAILIDSEVALNAGRTIASDWEEAKERIKKNVAEYVQKQHKSRQEKLHNASAVSQAWNHFNEQCGAFADEYSTL